MNGVKTGNSYAHRGREVQISTTLRPRPAPGLRVKSRKFWGGGSESEPQVIMKIEMWPVNKLLPYAKNARKISDQAVEKVASSILGVWLPTAACRR
jgi:hypothetical protein